MTRAATRLTKRWALIAALVLGVAGAAEAGSVASLAGPGRVLVTVPAGARDARAAMLELSIGGGGASAGANAGAVVRLRRGARAVELGRLSLTPEAAHGVRRYQFDVRTALKRLDLGANATAEVEVELIDRGSDGPIAAGPSFNVQSARIVTR